MVDVVEVQQAGYRIAKTGTSGYDSTPDAVTKLNEVSLDVMNLLTPHYGKIEALDDILNYYVTEAAPTFVSGAYELPGDFYGLIGMNKTTAGSTIPLRKMKTNAIGAIGQNSIRKPTVAKPKYYLRNGNLVLVPSNGDAGTSWLYFRKPATVSITSTPTEGETDDYEAVTDQTDFDFPFRLKNLLIYLFVERLGMEMKEPILFEISQLGISQNLTVNSANVPAPPVNNYKRY